MIFSKIIKIMVLHCNKMRVLGKDLLQQAHVQVINIMKIFDKCKYTKEILNRFSKNYFSFAIQDSISSS